MAMCNDWSILTDSKPIRLYVFLWLHARTAVALLAVSTLGLARLIGLTLLSRRGWRHQRKHGVAVGKEHQVAPILSATCVRKGNGLARGHARRVLNLDCVRQESDERAPARQAA